MTTGWTSTTLGDIANIVSGATPKTSVAEFWDGDVPWATPKDLSSLDDAEISATPRTLSTAGLRSCAASLLPPNSVLLSSRAPIGHVAINTVPMATNQGFKSFVLDAGRVDAKFLYWWLKRNRPLLESLGNGATFKEISKKVTAAVPIELPPIEEQRRIAAVLDAADALRVKRVKALQLGRQLEDATFARFIDAFATEEVQPLSEVVERVTVGHVGPTAAHFAEDGVPFIRTGDVGDGQILWDHLRHITPTFHATLRKSTVRAGDLLISRVISTKVRAAIVPAELDGANCANVIVVRPGVRMSASFLLALIRLPASQHALLGQRVGSAQSVVNTGVLKKWPIPVPPPAALIALDTHMKAIRSLTSSHQSSLEVLQILFATLQQRAFRGEL